MASVFRGGRQPVVLDQITYFERRIRERQQTVRHYAASCRRDMRDGLTSPRTLLAVSAVGFLAGTLTRRPSVRARTGQEARPRAATILGSALASIAAIRPWLPLLRRLGAALISKSETVAREPESRAPPPL
jgi:hypothetical protein